MAQEELKACSMMLDMGVALPVRPLKYLHRKSRPRRVIMRTPYMGSILRINRLYLSMGVTYDELKHIYDMTRKINEVLIALFDKLGITLVDFKIEFGRTSDGEIILADEVSPDTCRLWDKQTNEKLDKDRFRRDLGKVIEAYEEILSRLQTLA